MNLLAIVAGVSALAHLAFAYKEFHWKRSFVESAAPGLESRPQDTDAHIMWAEPLAFNMASYNLLLALGARRDRVGCYRGRPSRPLAGPTLRCLATRRCCRSRAYRSLPCLGTAGCARLAPPHGGVAAETGLIESKNTDPCPCGSGSRVWWVESNGRCNTMAEGLR